LQLRRVAPRGAELDEAAGGGRVQRGEGLAEADAKGPEVSGAEGAVTDRPGVLDGRETARPAGAGELQGLADAPGGGPGGCGGGLGEEGEVLDVLVAATERLEADGGDGERAVAAGVEEGEGVGALPGVAAADGLPGEDAVDAEGPGVEAPGQRLDV